MVLKPTLKQPIQEDRGEIGALWLSDYYFIFRLVYLDFLFAVAPEKQQFFK